jgi:hypothetical protein
MIETLLEWRQLASGGIEEYPDEVVVAFRRGPRSRTGESAKANVRWRPGVAPGMMGMGADRETAMIAARPVHILRERTTDGG